MNPPAGGRGARLSLCCGTSFLLPRGIQKAVCLQSRFKAFVLSLAHHPHWTGDLVALTDAPLDTHSGMMWEKAKDI